MNAEKIAVSVYYHDRNKDGLMLDCVRPLVPRLREAGAERLFVVRGWQRGPHLGLVVASESAKLRRTIVPLVETETRRYVKENPSRRALTEESFRATQDKLALFEVKEPSASTVQPDNTIVVGPYAPDAVLRQTAESITAWESFCEAVLPLAFRIIEASRDDRGVRMAIAAKLLFKYASRLGGIERGYLFCRSYIEKYLAYGVTDPAAVRAAMQKAYAARRERLLEILDEVDTTLPAADPIVDAWESLYETFVPTVRTLVDEGHVQTPDPKKPPEFLEEWGSKFRYHSSEYLTALEKNDELWERLRTDPSYGVHFVFVNYLYSLFHIVGITGAEKIFLLGFVYRAVEDKYGCRARGLLLI